MSHKTERRKHPNSIEFNHQSHRKIELNILKYTLIHVHQKKMGKLYRLGRPHSELTIENKHLMYASTIQPIWI